MPDRAAAKMFYAGAAPDDPLWDGFTDGYVLQLIRENALAAVVSKKLLRRSGAWRARAGGTYDAEPVTVLPAECEEHLTSLRARVLWTRARFAGPLYREIRYATVADPGVMAEALARLFGDAVALETRVKQQRLRALREVAEVAAFDCDAPLADPAHLI